MTYCYELSDFTWWLCLSVSRLWAERIDEIFEKILRSGNIQFPRN